MANGPGKKVLNLRSVFGLQATVTTPSAATGGDYVEMDMMLEPGGHTNSHYHPEQDETFEVLEGTLESSVRVIGIGFQRESRRQCRVGRPIGSATRRDPVRFLNVHQPALTFQEYLETVDRLIRTGKVRGLKGLRSGIYISMAAVQQGMSVQIKSPQALMRALAFIGRRLGYTLD